MALKTSCVSSKLAKMVKIWSKYRKLFIFACWNRGPGSGVQPEMSKSVKMSKISQKWLKWSKVAKMVK